MPITFFRITKVFSIGYCFITLLPSLVGQEKSVAHKTGAHYEKLANDTYNSDQANKTTDSVAVNYYKLAANAYLNSKDHQNYVKILNYLNAIYYGGNSIQAFNENSTIAYQAAEKHLAKTDPHYIWALEQLSTRYYALSDYKKSIELLHQVLDSRIASNNEKIHIANTSQSLANTYKFIGDYENAKIYFSKALRLTKEIEDEDIQEDFVSYKLALLNDIAQHYEKTADIDSAFHYIQLAYPLIDQTKSTRHKANYFLLAANITSLYGDHRQALIYAHKAMRYSNTKDYYAILQLETLGKIHSRIGKHTKALELYNSAHSLAEEVNIKNTSSFKSKRFIELFRSANQIGDNNQAMSYLNSGISVNSISDEFITDDLFLNKMEALFFISEKGKINFNKYLSSRNKKDLLIAYQDFLSSENLTLQIRSEILTEESKNTLAKQTQDVVEGALNCAYELYSLTKKQKYLSEAFDISEKNKARVLMEKLTDINARGLSALPDSLLLQERDLELRIAQIKQALLLDPSIQSELKTQYNDLLINKDQLVHKLEREFPTYFANKYNYVQVTKEELQQTHLQANEDILEYYVGLNDIFLISISQDTQAIFKIKYSNTLKQAINNIARLLQNPPSSASAQTEYTSFVKSSTYVYNKLIKAAAETMNQRLKRLIIIPDKNLNSIPLEVLLKSESAKPSYDLNRNEYLFEDFAISYQYSATHHTKTQSEQENYDLTFLGFAPTFDGKSVNKTRNCDGSEIQNLLCNEEEIIVTSDIFDSQIFVGPDASIGNFEVTVNSARIVHLATHTCLSPVSSSLNRIYLADNTISMLDLTHSSINAELVVLSACNTGVGEYVDGDGVQSLAWSFMNAGSASTLMSLWAIDDCATSDFMKMYYLKLKQGLKKDIALQQAKIEFISTMPKANQHPFYWSPFITYGDMSPLEVESFSVRSIVFTGLGVLGIIVFVFLSRKRKKSYKKFS